MSAAVTRRRVKWIDRGSSCRADLPGRAIYDPNGAAAIIAFIIFGVLAAGLWTSEGAVPVGLIHSRPTRVLPNTAAGKMDSLRLPGEHIHVDRFHLPGFPEERYQRLVLAVRDAGTYRMLPLGYTDTNAATPGAS